nr:zinc finger, CCHC-type [Tanacetum cinerariifolium]
MLSEPGYVGFLKLGRLKGRRHIDLESHRMDLQLDVRKEKYSRFKKVRLKKLGSKQVGFKQLGHKQVGFKQLGPGVETGFHRVQDEKHVWCEVELQGDQGDREAKVFQVSNDDTAVAQRWLEDKQPKEKTNTDCLVKEQEKEHLGIKVGENITVTRVPGKKGAKGNVAEKNKVKESMKAKLIVVDYGYSYHPNMVISTRNTTGPIPNETYESFRDVVARLQDSVTQLIQSVQTLTTNNDNVILGQQYLTTKITKFRNGEDPLEEIKNLRQEGAVPEYQDKFESLISTVEVTESQVISLFVGGLQLEIGIVVKMFRPRSLYDAYQLVRMQETTKDVVNKSVSSILVCIIPLSHSSSSYLRTVISNYGVSLGRSLRFWLDHRSKS